MTPDEALVLFEEALDGPPRPQELRVESTMVAAMVDQIASNQVPPANVLSLDQARRNRARGRRRVGLLVGAAALCTSTVAAASGAIPAIPAIPALPESWTNILPILDSPDEGDQPMFELPDIELPPHPSDAPAGQPGAVVEFNEDGPGLAEGSGGRGPVVVLPPAADGDNPGKGDKSEDKRDEAEDNKAGPSEEKRDEAEDNKAGPSEEKRDKTEDEKAAEPENKGGKSEENRDKADPNGPEEKSPEDKGPEDKGRPDNTDPAEPKAESSDLAPKRQRQPSGRSASKGEKGTESGDDSSSKGKPGKGEGETSEGNVGDKDPKPGKPTK